MFVKALLTVLPLLLTIKAAETSQAPEVKQVVITSQRNSTLCMTAKAENDQITAGTEVQLSTCVDASAPQYKFQKWAQTDGTYCLKGGDPDPRYVSCLSRTDNGAKDGSSVILASNMEANLREFMPGRTWTYREDGHLRTISDTGTNKAAQAIYKCLDLEEGSIVENGDVTTGRLQLWDCVVGNQNQGWTVTDV